MTLNELIERMEADAEFAKFIAGLLAKGCNNKGARDCLASYYSPTSSELTALGVPKKHHEFCTVPPPTGGTTNYLIVVPANRCAKRR